MPWWWPFGRRGFGGTRLPPLPVDPHERRMHVFEIVRRRASASWAQLEGLPPDAVSERHPSMRVSQILVHEARAFVDVSFARAAYLARERSDVAGALAALREALTMVRRGEAYCRRGTWDVVEDRLRARARFPDETPQLLLEVVVGQGRPSRAEGWTTEDACAEILDEDRIDRPMCPEVLHALRSVVRHDAALAAGVHGAAVATYFDDVSPERDILRWCIAVTDTARALVVEGTSSGAARLQAQLEMYAGLDRACDDVVESWLAQLPDDHQELSIDWTAVAFCRLRPGLLELVAPSRFLPAPLSHRTPCTPDA